MADCEAQTRVANTRQLLRQLLRFFLLDSDSLFITLSGWRLAG